MMYAYYRIIALLCILLPYLCAFFLMANGTQTDLTDLTKGTLYSIGITGRCGTRGGPGPRGKGDFLVDDAQRCHSLRGRVTVL